MAEPPTTLTLAALQRHLLDAIAERRPVDARLLSHLAGDARLDGAGRLAIYGDMYLARLHEALSFQFPSLLAAVGEDDFLDLARAYLAACPPRSPSLRWLGERLAGFLEPPRGAAWHRPWLADLARLDYARLDVFDAPDEELLTMARLRAMAPEALTALPLALCAAHRVLEVTFAVERTWRSLDEGRECAPPARAPHRLLVWRQGVAVYHRALEGVEATLLPALSAPFTLAALCERIAAEVGDEAAGGVTFELLGRWVEDELVAG